MTLHVIVVNALCRVDVETSLSPSIIKYLTTQNQMPNNGIIIGTLLCKAS